MSLTVGLLIIAVLLGANGFFVAVEFALVAADRSKLEQLAADGSWRARAAVSARRNLSFHLSGAQLGITVTSLVLGFLVDSLVSPLLAPITDRVWFLQGPTVSVIVALAVASTFQMVIGELFPKALAISAPERMAMALAPIAVVVHGGFGPIIRLFNGIANKTLQAVGVEPTEELSEVHSLDELALIIETSSEGGAIAPDATSMLNRTLRFGDKTAADALRPRVQVESIGAGATGEDLIATSVASNYSRFPVVDGDLDHVLGVVDAASVLTLPFGERDAVEVTALMKEPLVVPETRDLIDIVEDFRSSSHQMAVVIDEHGGTAGILTLEDVLEEIVGEVDDEYDNAEVLTAGVGPGIYVLAGTLHPDEVEEACGFSIPEGEYETIAGFVLERLGRIPDVGESAEHEGWEITVAEMDALRIASLRLVAPQVEASTDGADQR